MAETQVMPMFPLGTPLLPGTVLPLYLFEDRYLQLFSDLGDGGEFAVVLIQRGSESRDDNPTFSVGCIARIAGSARHDDGSLSIVTVGTLRIRILEWLDSRPYPRAEVETLPPRKLTAVGEAQVLMTLDKLPRLMALAAELDPELSAAVPELSDDPLVASHQVAHMLGSQPLDVQQILEEDDPDARVAKIDSLLESQLELIELQLRMG